MRDKRIWLIGCLIALLALIVAWESWENKGAYGLGGTIDLEEWQPFFGNPSSTTRELLF